MLLAVRISSYGCTWEVWRALKKLELLSATPPATLTLLSCSPNFPRASITRYTHAKHEPVLKCSVKDVTFVCDWSTTTDCPLRRVIRYYNIDTSVLLENKPLVKFIRNYIRDPSGVFSISSLVRILMTSFPAFSRLFVQTVSKIEPSDGFAYIIKRKIHGCMKI